MRAGVWRTRLSGAGGELAVAVNGWSRPLLHLPQQWPVDVLGVDDGDGSHADDVVDIDTALEHVDRFGQPLQNRADDFRAAETPIGIRRTPPCFGQPTREVLGRLLALTDAQIDELPPRWQPTRRRVSGGPPNISGPPPAMNLSLITI